MYHGNLHILIATITRDIVWHEKRPKIGKDGMNGCKVGEAVTEHWICIAPNSVVSTYSKQ
jgi:hypothetical protein